MSKRIIFACYGGGHLESLLPVWYELKKCGLFSLDFLAFTLAKSELERLGESPIGYDEAFGEYISNLGWDSELDSLIPELDNEKISLDDHQAYYRAGIQSLVQMYGEPRASEIYRSEGRKAFLPRKLMCKYLQATKPDMLITSASPRSERALVEAACELGIPCLVISDLFLVTESDYMCTDKYFADVTVLNGKVADFLRSKGYKGKIHATGNPAFDSFVNKCAALAKTDEAPASSQENRPVNLTWIGSGAGGGGQYINTLEAMTFLEDFASDKNLNIAFRPHPGDSSNITLPNTVRLLSDCTLEEVLDFTDIILVEGSTVAVKAALAGVEVWSLGKTPYPEIFEAYGIARNINDFSGLKKAFDDYSDGVRFNVMKNDLSPATLRIKKLILSKLEG